MTIYLLNSDARNIPLADQSVQCIITSPPYYGLRDYGIPNQIGLERTPQEYVASIIAVMRECWRVLKDDGVLWLNLGDSYFGDSPMRKSGAENFSKTWDKSQTRSRGGLRRSAASVDGLKPKDLIGIPWRCAFALQDDGWVLRSEVIWSKPNPMPESVTDRPTKAHEQVFLFSKAKWVGPDRGRFAYISNDDAKWLALFLDTEGNICAKRARASSGTDHFGTQICFASTSKSLLEMAKSIIDAGTVLKRAGKNAPMYYLQLSNIQAADLLYRIYPFLIVKQRQAQLAIHLQRVISESGRERRTKEGKARGRMRADEYTDELIRIWEAMKSLNHFGDPDLSWLPEVKYGHWDSARYYYDAEAIKESGSIESAKRLERGVSDNHKNINGAPGQTPHSMNQPRPNTRNGNSEYDEVARNRRSVWTVATTPYSGAHFATFPPKLIEPMVLAGSRAGDIVLDPFAGTATVGRVAIKHQRRFVGLDLNLKYIGDLAKERTSKVQVSMQFATEP